MSIFSTPLAKKAAVIGDPISHSLSPKLHGYLLNKFKIDGIYLPFQVKKEDLESQLQSFAKEGFKGCNVTLPHKEKVLKICHRLSKSAKAIGAVNTIIINDQGEFYGHNSDGEGFIKNITLHQPDFDFNNKKVVLLGAGGASRAICYALIQKKVGQITIINRNIIRAAKIMTDFKQFAQENDCLLQSGEWSEIDKFLPNCNLLINGTSLGMEGQNPLPEINFEILDKQAVICDIVYKPLMTNLLIAAKNNGHPIVTGVGMLIYQALVGFEAWYKFKVTMDKELSDQLYKHLI